MTDVKDQIELKLSLEQVNLVLAGLGKAQYDQVSGLIDAIKEEAQPQADVISQNIEAAIAGIEDDEAKKEAASAVDRVVELNLTMDQVNTVLNVIGQLPYVQVVSTIDAIIEQGRPQAEVIEAAQAEAAE